MTEQERLTLINRSRAVGFNGHCGIRVEQAPDGASRVSCRIEAHHLNPNMTAHGGIIFTVMDTAAGVAALTVSGLSRTVVTQCADVHFLRPVRPGPLYAEGKVVKSGRQTALVTVEVLDEDGVLHAYGSFEIFYIDKP